MIRPWKKKRSNSPWHHPLNSKHQIYIYIMLVYYKCLLNWSLVDYVPSHVYNNYTFYSFNMHIQKISTNCSITYNIYKQKTTTTTKKRKNWLTIHILTTMDLPNKHPMQKLITRPYNTHSYAQIYTRLAITIPPHKLLTSSSVPTLCCSVPSQMRLLSWLWYHLRWSKESISHIYVLPKRTSQVTIRASQNLPSKQLM